MKTKTTFTFIITLMLTMFCAIVDAQTLYDSNNKLIAKVNADGTIRSQYDQLLGSIDEYGVIWDGYHQKMGRFAGENTILDQYERIIGIIDKDGSITNGPRRPVGKITKKGKVIGAGGFVMGYAKDVDRRITAVFFFTDFFQHR